MGLDILGITQITSLAGLSNMHHSHTVVCCKQSNAYFEGISLV